MADRKLAITVAFGARDGLLAPLRALTQGAKAFSNATTETTRKLAALKTAQYAIGNYKGAEQRFRETAQALDQARQKVDAMRDRIDEAGGTTRKLAAELKRLKDAETTLAWRFERQGQELQRLSRGLGAAGVDVAQLGKHEERLGHQIYETTNLLKRQQAELKRHAAIEKTATNIRAGAGKLAIAGAVASTAAIPALGAVGDAREFQSIMVDIGQKANLSGDATKRIADNLLKVAPKIAQLPTDLARGVDTLAGLGLDPQLAAKLIRPIGTAATAYKADIADLSNATFSSVDNLKVPIGQVARTLDVMAQAGKSGAFELKDMAAQFPALTAAAAGLGQRGVSAVADLAAAAQITRKGAGDSATAANNLLNLLNKINSKETVDNFSKFGINLQTELKKATKLGKSPIEAIVEQTQRATKGDFSKLSYLFGDAQVQAALRPLLSNLDLYRQIRADAIKATGTIEADFQVRVARDGAAAQRRYNAQLERFQVVAGNLLLPALTRLLEVGGDYADKLALWAEANPQLAQALLLVATTAGTLLTAAAGLAGVFSFILKPAWSILGWARAIGPLFAGLAAAIGLPLSATIALVAAVVGAAYVIYSNWSKIDKWFRSLSWADVGRFLAQGLINGFLAVSPIGFFVRYAGLIGSKFKSVLGIKSPSRVFAGIGGNIMAGLTQGLDQGGGGPVKSLQRQAGRLTGALAASSLAVSPGSALAARPAGGAGGGQAVTVGRGPTIINIYAQPGQDAQAIARAVDERLAARDRAADARQRASYRDDA